MTEHAKRLHDLISHSTADRDLAAAACHLICAAPEAEQPKLFHQFLLEHKYTESDETQASDLYFKRADVELYGAACTELLNQWMEELQAEYPDEDAFHAALWKKICRLSNEVLRAMMVFVCAEDTRLPYLSPSRTALGDGYTTETFQTCAKELDPMQTALMHHILNQEYERVSQDAAALLPLLEACPTQKDKVLLLSEMFLSVHQKIEIAELKEILRKAAEEELDEMIRQAIEEYDD